MKYPKHQYVRSTKLMVAYRKLPCQNCGIEDGTVCGAHSNQLSSHKGRGIKADDNLCASLCWACHTKLDAGSKLSREEKINMWDAAWRKTVKALVSNGNWPINIPIPDIRVFH